MTKIHTRAKQAAVGIAAAGLLALSLATPSVQAAPKAREILTVIANLNKAYGGIHEGKLHDMTSVRAFVTRTLQVTPYPPDVVLLQELRGEGAKAAANSFTNKTHQKYIVAIGPPRNHPTRDYPGKQIHTETAILLNTTTMTKASKGGFIKSTYTHAQANGPKVKVKKHAFLLATQISSGMDVALTSVHFTPGSDIKSKSISDSLRAKWSKQIVQNLKTRYPGAALTDIGGDFNAIRCFSGSFKSCKVAAFWKYFTDNKFVDSLYVLPQPGGGGAISCMTRATGVDFIWSDGNPEKGGIDGKGGYSDHKLRWVVNSATPYHPC